MWGFWFENWFFLAKNRCERKFVLSPPLGSGMFFGVSRHPFKSYVAVSGKNHLLRTKKLVFRCFYIGGIIGLFGAPGLDSLPINHNSGCRSTLSTRERPHLA